MIPGTLKHKEEGVTILELIATLSIVAIITAIAIGGLREMQNPLSSGIFSTEQFLRLARSKALSTTQVIEITPVSNTRLVASSGLSCTGALTEIQNFNLDLPTGATFTDTSWSICFNQRGLADNTTSIQISNQHSEKKTIKVALGGGTKVE